MSSTMDHYRDTTLRDGLQLTGKLIDVETKVRVIRGLFGLGVTQIEIGSMAHPDLVPPMANSLQVIAALTAEELDRSWVWVATPRQMKRAAEAGACRFQFCFSASESHNQANVNRSVDASLDGFAETVVLAREAGGTVQLALATSFTCPFDGPIDPDRVFGIVTDARLEGATDVVLADTIGQAVPNEVTALVGAAVGELTARVAFHGHDTWGLGVANSIAALHAGAAFVDGTLGALGGCPFAPGASLAASLSGRAPHGRAARLSASATSSAASTGNRVVETRRCG